MQRKQFGNVSFRCVPLLEISVDNSLSPLITADLGLIVALPEMKKSSVILLRRVSPLPSRQLSILPGDLDEIVEPLAAGNASSGRKPGSGLASFHSGCEVTERARPSTTCTLIGSGNILA